MEMEYRRPIERKDDTVEALPLPDAYYEAYKEGNLRFPQSGLGMDIMVAAAALSDPDFDPAAFSRMEWTDAQLADIKEMMNRAHAAMHIPVASEDRLDETVAKINAYHGEGAATKSKSVPDAVLRRLWSNTKNTTLLKMAIVSGLDGGEKDWSDSDQSDAASIQATIPKLATRLSDPEVRARVRDAFLSFAETLRGPRGREMMMQIKGQLDNRRRGLPKDSTDRDMRDDAVGSIFFRLNELLVEEYRAKGGTLLDSRAESFLRANYG